MYEKEITAVAAYRGVGFLEASLAMCDGLTKAAKRDDLACRYKDGNFRFFKKISDPALMNFIYRSLNERLELW
jgi:hypothetical protein